MKPRVEVTERGVELLLASTTLDDLDRALLEAASGCEGLQAVELWRRHGATWLPVLARGPRELLPSDELVRAAAEGVIEGQLPCGAQVLACIGSRCMPRSPRLCLSAARHSPLLCRAAIADLRRRASDPPTFQKLEHARVSRLNCALGGNDNTVTFTLHTPAHALGFLRARGPPRA